MSGLCLDWGEVGVYVLVFRIEWVWSLYYQYVLISVFIV